MKTKKRNNAVRCTKYRYELAPMWDLAGLICSYCGVEGSMTEDHVIPVSGMADLMQFDQNLKSWTVPACHECNSNLSARNPYVVDGMNDPRRTFERKREWARAAIENKYVKKRRFNSRWSVEELANKDIMPGVPEDMQLISRSLAEYISNSYTREEIERRLQYDCFLGY